MNNYIGGYPATGSTNTKKISKLITTTRLLMVVIALQLLVIGFLGYNYYVSTQNSALSVAQKAAKAAGVSSSKMPINVVELDEKMLEELTSANQIQQEVYKDAKAGDYAVIYEDRFLLFRKKENKVIYDGKSPAQIAQDVQDEMFRDIIDKSKQSGLIGTESEEVPELSVVNSAESMKQNDPTFYAQVQIGDIVVVYPQSNIIALYRPDSKVIYNAGVINTSIQPR